MESLPDAVVVIDELGRIRQVNAHSEALFGYDRSELLGQVIELLVPDWSRGRQTMSISLCARHKDGRELPVEIMSGPGAGGCVIALVRDISERRDLEHFRDEYIGYISHDLKNPLSVITLQARLVARKLAERKLREEARGVEAIVQSAAFMGRLVRDLLEMSYAESQDVQIRREATDLAGFLKDVLERTVSTGDRRRVHLRICDEATALVDATRIERVVVNFVQNALKYAARHSPIQVRLEARDGMAVVSVIDEGPGLTAEEASFIFDKYRRTTTAGKRDGLGLGLYVSRKIVEAHGGRIGVDSITGKGSRFFFEVPLAARETMERSRVVTLEPSPADYRACLRGVHVLLVDDEVNAVSALAALLADEGLTVSTATNGEQALATAERRPPDVVLLDVEMPKMSGLTLLAGLRTRLPGIPAVFMTGYLAHHVGIAEAREATGAAYIGKPVDVDELVRVLAQAVRSSPSSSRELHQPPALPAG